VGCGDSVAQHCGGEVYLSLLILESAGNRLVCNDDTEHIISLFVLCVVLMTLLECAVQTFHLGQLLSKLLA